MWTSALFGSKNFGIFEIYGVFEQMWGRGSWASTDILQTRRKGASIFRDFVLTSFMDSPYQKT